MYTCSTNISITKALTLNCFMVCLLMCPLWPYSLLVLSITVKVNYLYKISLQLKKYHDRLPFYDFAKRSFHLQLYIADVPWQNIQ